MPQGRIAVISIGINYKGQRGELYGCVNDSNNFLKFINVRFKHHLVFRQQLVDTLPARHPRFPTKRNITRALNQAVNLCRRRNITHLWVHYSGHGGQQRDRNRDERDRLDETLLPVDWARHGTISDDWLLSRVVHRVPPRTQFFGLIDACHSASMLDLRWGLEPVGDRRYRRRLVNRKASQRPRAVMISGAAITATATTPGIAPTGLRRDDRRLSPPGGSTPEGAAGQHCPQDARRAARAGLPADTANFVDAPAAGPRKNSGDRHHLKGCGG